MTFEQARDELLDLAAARAFGRIDEDEWRAGRERVLYAFGGCLMARSVYGSKPIAATDGLPSDTTKEIRYQWVTTYNDLPSHNRHDVQGHAA